MLTEEQRNGLINTEYRWPNKVVPFAIDEVFSKYCSTKLQSGIFDVEGKFMHYEYRIRTHWSLSGRNNGDNYRSYTFKIITHTHTHIYIYIYMYISSIHVRSKQDGSLNFLDLTITKTTSERTFQIFRKSTKTDTIIPNDSCHHFYANLAAIRHFANRIHTYHLDHLQKQKEIDNVKQIIHSNKYNTSLLNRTSKNTQKNKDTNRKTKTKDELSSHISE
jgi:hypothetical protein